MTTLMNGQIMAAVKKNAEQRVSLIRSLQKEKERLVLALSEVDRFLRDLRGPVTLSIDEETKIYEEKANDVLSQKLTHSDLVMQTLKEHPNLSASEIALMAGRDVKSIAKAMSRLHSERRLKRSGTFGKYKYKI